MSHIPAQSREKGYKVVKVLRDGALISCTDTNGIYSAADAKHCSKNIVTYFVDIAVIPRENCGPLAVFKDLESARMFSENLFGGWGSAVIYECEYVRSEKNYLKRHDRLGDIRVQFKGMPWGTVFASSVSLKKIVRREFLR